MSISTQQHKILLLLEAGHRIHIVRSPLTQEPTFAVLIHPSEPSAVQYLPWWRIERLVDTGHAHLSDPDRRVATEVLVSPAYASRRKRRKTHP